MCAGKNCFSREGDGKGRNILKYWSNSNTDTIRLSISSSFPYNHLTEQP